MKNLAKRGLALLLVLVMCLSMVPAVTLTADAATVDYTYASNGKYIYNWGQRGTTATFLSPNAISYYTGNNTYEKLSALAGSSADEPNGSALYNALHSLMESTHTYKTTYDATKDLYMYTDCQNGGGAISSFYSGSSIGPAWGQGSWNREHTWPNSKGLEGKDEDDLMMLRPTATSENSSRGNVSYGESSGYHNPNKASNYTLDLRGDVARITLGHYVRWELIGRLWGHYKVGDDWYGNFESKEVLLKWMEEDPVDTWELGRNDAAQSILGYRNVFVDYPELAYLLFNEEIPSNMKTPSGMASASGYQITAVANNNAFGTVALSGRTINAFPATGYEVAGFTVISGTATVTRDGDAFTVSATSDCTVQINFQARSVAVLTVQENGVTANTITQYVGDTIKLPEAKNAAPTGYTFLGWVTAPVEDTTEQPTIYTVGSNFKLESAAAAIYALYSRVVTDANVESNLFELYNGPIEAGDYLLISNYGAMKAEINSDRFYYSADLTFTDENATIVSPSADIIWTIANSGDSFTLYNEATSSYAAGTGAKNAGKLQEAMDDFALWNISQSEANYVFENVGNEAKGVNYTLRRNGNYGFACYSASYGTGIELYKRAEGTVYYSTSASACKHANTTSEAAVAASCTAAGYTAGVLCTDCNTYIEGHELIAPLGHKYESVVTEPTETEQGYTTHTCTACGDSYKDSYVDPVTPDAPVPSEPAEIVKAAYALEPGAKLPSAVTLTGTITTVKTAYSASYGNVTVIITVAGCEDMPITCYRLKGSGADQIAVGDTITVTGTIVNYQHSSGDTEVEFEAGCTLDSWVDNTETPETPDTPVDPDQPVPTDPQGIVDAAYALEPGAKLSSAVTLTGTITKVKTGYDSQYQNVTVIMVVASREDKPITCFRLKGTGADLITEGDTITVTGTIIKYQHSSGDTEVEFEAGCTLDSWVDNTVTPDVPVDPDVPVGESAELSFASKDNRIDWSTTQQIWSQNNITLTNLKSKSTSPVADYANPARFYKSSSITVEAANMIKLVFNCNTSSYATALKNSLPTTVDAVVSGNDVTITLPTATDSFTIENLSGGQVRVNKLTVYFAAGGCEHDYKDEVTEPTETEQGYTTHTCTLCGNSYVDTYTPALGFDYTVSFAVPAGVDAIAPMISNTNTGIELPEAGVPAAYGRYTFAGWSLTSVSETATAPSLLNGNYIALSDITLYPVYTYYTGSAQGAYTLVTDASALTSGATVIIVAVEAEYAMSTNQKTSNRGAAAVTKHEDGSITISEDVVLLQLAAGTVDGSFAFSTGAGYLFAASSSSNHLKTQASVDNNASWVITIDENGVASVIAQGTNSRNVMQYNPNNNNPLFACYGSASQKALSIYTLSSGGAQYYTSLDAKETVAYKVMVGENGYMTVTEALEDTSADYIVLLDDVEDDIIITSDVTIDLNGCILTADIQIDDGATLYLFDSATADYTAENRGGVMGAIEGNLATVMNTPASYGHNYKYLTIQEEDGMFSAHRIYLAVKSATLVPQTEDGATKVSYKTVFKCSDLVASYVEAYGAQIAGSTTVTSAYDIDLAAGTNEGIVWLVNSLSAENSDEVNAANALAAPAVSAYIQIGGEIIASASVSLSIQDLIVAADAMELTNIQKVALGYMYSLFQPIMDAWDVSIENIKSYGQYWN